MAERPFEPTGTTVVITPTGGSAFTMEYITITPPGWDGGEAIDTTTLGNVKYRTKMAPTLIDIGAMSFTAEMDPAKIHDAPINLPGVIVITIPDIGTWTLQGYLKSITGDQMQVGERATCSGEIVITNTGSDGATETGPSWSSTGTRRYDLADQSLAQLRLLGASLGVENYATLEAGPLIAAINAAIAGLT